MEVLAYFDPVDFSQFQLNGRTAGRFSLGNFIEKNTNKLDASNIAGLDVVIWGVPVDSRKPGEISDIPDKIRGELFQLAMFNNSLRIADVGNLKPAKSLKGTFLALRDVIEYFNELNIISFIVGGSQDLTVGMCEAFKNHHFFSLSAIDAVLDVKRGIETFYPTNYLTRIFNRFPNLFQFSLTGYQKHLVSDVQLKKTAGVAEHIRLGQLRENFSQIEPLMRNTDVLSFDMGAIKHCEAPSTWQKNPNGLRGEEACQIARYSGMSNRLKVFGLFDLAPGKEDCLLSLKLAAEIMWYFFEGCIIRGKDHLKTDDSKVFYKVEVDNMDQPFVFLNDPETGRWWFEISSVTGETHRVACSEEEYRQAAANEIPGRWLKYIQKMDGLSK